MPGVSPDVITHRLSIFKEARPISQKKRDLGNEKRLAAKEEAGKLLSAGFIREARYTTWLANVVMVTEPNGNWRMCVDYRNINSACLKDTYPLPNIDRLVDGAASHKIMSFLDAYSSYNQISMHPRDKEKTAFMTADANYYYEVMPFGLKNAGATYQRLMDKVFKDLIGRAVEVYVDDIAVKSDSFDQHLKDLDEVFRALRGVNMKLNPEKCTFGVEGGKFLGFMLTHRGIEANPDKCQAILNMRSPNSIKEVQQLLGRLTALSRFVPRLAERTRPMSSCSEKVKNSPGTTNVKKSSNNSRSSSHPWPSSRGPDPTTRSLSIWKSRRRQSALPWYRKPRARSDPYTSSAEPSTQPRPDTR